MENPQHPCGDIETKQQKNVWVIRLLDAYGGCGVFRSAAFGPLLGSWHDGDGMMAGWGSSIRKFQESLCFARVFLEVVWQLQERMWMHIRWTYLGMGPRSLVSCEKMTNFVDPKRSTTLDQYHDGRSEDRLLQWDWILMVQYCLGANLGLDLWIYVSFSCGNICCQSVV